VLFFGGATSASLEEHAVHQAARVARFFLTHVAVEKRETFINDENRAVARFSVGRATGLEPATAGITTRSSTS
jgi:hypothetical protein